MAIDFNKYRSIFNITVRCGDLEINREGEHITSTNRSYASYTESTDEIEFFDFEELLLHYFEWDRIEADLSCVQPMWYGNGEECGFTVDYVADVFGKTCGTYDCRQELYLEINDIPVTGSDLQELFPNIER